MNFGGGYFFADSATIKRKGENIMNDEHFLMWLTRIDGIGNKKLRLLLENFDTAKDIWTAPKNVLESIQGLTSNNIYNIIKSRDETLMDSYISEMEKKNIRFISLYNRNYPPLLQMIPDPPIGIYILGNYPLKDEIFVSIIGSRKCTEYGRTSAYRLAKDLAAKDVVIVSGLAKGIDAMAHQGAVDAGGVTIAVLGCGVDICYPLENHKLRSKILERGCLISEFPPATEPHPSYFPLRNRIISGLSRAVVVAEATRKSGTSITVGQALDQGREVLAIPGKITSKWSEGTNDLIQQGAGLVSSAQDVLDALGIFQSISKKSELQNLESLAPDEKLVYDCISFNPITIDEIITVTGSNLPAVNYILVLLEIKGRIKKLQGQRYVRS